MRPIFKSYDVFAPAREPAGYRDGLQQLEPSIVWDDQGHDPALATEEDWIKAGEIVFDSAVVYEGITTAADVTHPDWYAKTGTLVTKAGLMPYYRYVIRQKGKLELGRLTCASCHTRVTPVGSTIKGAQGNFPFDLARAYAFRTGRFKLDLVRALERSLFAAPWLKPDPNAQMDGLSIEEIAAMHAAVPAGVSARHRSSAHYPVQVPDLIGVNGPPLSRPHRPSAAQLHRGPEALRGAEPRGGRSGEFRPTRTGSMQSRVEAKPSLSERDAPRAMRRRSTPTIN